MNVSPRKNANGCLWLVVVILVLGVSFGVMTISFDLPVLVTLLISVAASIFITLKLVGKPTLISIIKNIVAAVLILGLLTAGISLLFTLVTSKQDSVVFTAEETVARSTYVEGTDTLLVYASARRWRDNYGNDFNTTLTVRDRDYQQLKDHIRTYRAPSSRNFWGDLYDYIDRTDSPSLDLIMNGFNKIRKEKKLNTMEFAEMVVSCIQDIPYSFVFQEACLPADQYEYSIRTLLEQCPECCIGNIAFGIQNPVSFMQNLKGDCDTRTVLIYSILKHFGYDIAILNSDFYRHSILGINLPASGQHKIYNGKKYMLWETTAKYFSVGTLPSTYSDISHWNVVLTSK
jgi:hypothetical protein